MAVLPFENLTGDETFDVWEKGVARLVTSKLSGSDELYVLDSQAAFDILEGLSQPEPTKASLSLEKVRAVGERAGVENIILGELLQAGSQLRLSMRLVTARSGEVTFATQADACS